MYNDYEELQQNFEYKIKQVIQNPDITLQYMKTAIKKIISIFIALIADNWKYNCIDCKILMGDVWNKLEIHKLQFN